MGLADVIERMERPPTWIGLLGAEQQAFAVDVIRRMVFLRAGILQPVALSTALLTLAGAVALAWVDPRPAAYGAALSSWTRVLRYQALWLRIAPEPAMLQWLAQGGPPPGDP